MRQTLLDSPETTAEAAAVLKALGEPNRLRIFALLMNGQSCNCELAERLEMPANLLSHHLRVLSQAGLVRSRRDTIDGRWIYYRVDRAVTERWRALLNDLLDPARLQDRVGLCGPEGQLQQVNQVRASS